MKSGVPFSDVSPTLQNRCADFYFFLILVFSFVRADALTFVGGAFRSCGPCSPAGRRSRQGSEGSTPTPLTSGSRSSTSRCAPALTRNPPYDSPSPFPPASTPASSAAAPPPWPGFFSRRSASTPPRTSSGSSKPQGTTSFSQPSLSCGRPRWSCRKSCSATPQTPPLTCRPCWRWCRRPWRRKARRGWRYGGAAPRGAQRAAWNTPPTGRTLDTLYTEIWPTSG